MTLPRHPPPSVDTNGRDTSSPDLLTGFRLTLSKQPRCRQIPRLIRLVYFDVSAFKFFLLRIQHHRRGFETRNRDTVAKGGRVLAFGGANAAGSQRPSEKVNTT